MHNLRINLVIKNICILTIFLLSNNTWSSEIKIELKLSTKFIEYKSFFESPGYLVIAMQNSGIYLSNTKPINIINSKSIGYGGSNLNYIKNSGYIYYYIATYNLGGNIINIPISINLKNLNMGAGELIIDMPTDKLIPDFLNDKIESKIKSLTDNKSQKDLLDYLETIKNYNNDITLGILIDGYNFSNQQISKFKNEGRSEPLSDQLLFIFTLGVWLFCAPLFLYLVRRGRLKNLSK
jgi:hypothetical protein